MADAIRLGALTALPSAERTTDQTVDVDVGTSRYGALVVVTDLTAFTTAASLTVSVLGRDPLSGKTFTLLTSAAIVANGTNVLKVGRGLTAAANSVANDVVPPHLRIFVDHGNANPHTYSVGLVLCP